MSLDALLAEPGQLIFMVAALLGAGVVAGVMAGLLGIGGGIVIVPILYHLFAALGVDEAVRMHMAVGTSLATIVPTAVSSIRAHARRGAVDFDLLRLWAPAVFVGVVIGTALSGAISGNALSAVFAVVALLVAVRMSLRDASIQIADQLPGRVGQSAMGTVVGTLSAMMGIGGGTLTVPLLSSFSFPMQRAVGTAAAVGLVIALPGAVGFVLTGWGVPDRPPLSLGYVNLIGAVLIVPCTVLMAPVGARLAHAISPLALKRVFAVFLLFTSLRMFYELLS